jgi:hypothetical protein
MKRHDRYALADRDVLENDHSFAFAGAVDDAVGAGAIWTGAAGAAGARFGAGGFLAAASAGDAAAGVADAGRGAGAGAAVAAGGDTRAADDAGGVPGSGAMMLTGGVEAALGKSALVGLPVGTEAGSAATSPGAPAGGGAFQDGA